MSLQDPAKPSRRRRVLILAYVTAFATFWLAAAGYLIDPLLSVVLLGLGALATVALIAMAIVIGR